jgi:hypothetical protein
MREEMSESLSYASLERKRIAFFNEHQAWPSALRVSPELENTAFRLRNNEIMDRYGRDVIVREVFAVVVDWEFAADGWRWEKVDD